MEPSLRNSHSLRLFIGSNLNHQFFISATTALRRTRVRGVSLDSRIVALPPSQHTVSEYNLWMAFTKSIRKTHGFLERRKSHNTVAEYVDDRSVSQWISSARHDPDCFRCHESQMAKYRDEKCRICGLYGKGQKWHEITYQSGLTF